MTGDCLVFASLLLSIGTQARHDIDDTSIGKVSEKPRDARANIVLLLTDDQDVELGSMDFMPRTMRRIKGEGAEMRYAYSTTTVCCPSRSSLLTGLYVHNHGVYTNSENCSSSQWRRDQEPYSFAAYLSKGGYRTGYFGKYLNRYDGSYIPPGWRVWGGILDGSKYYDYTINMNGKLIEHGSDYGKDYFPDLIANESVNFLRESRKNYRNEPIMLVASFPSPHSPEDSAPQFSNLFFNVTTHHTPAYNYAPNPDKQWILRVKGKMPPVEKQYADLLMTKRLQALQSVDHAVERIYEELRSLGELENTYIIYTSDHGYHIGQFGLAKGKGFPFEFDVRVPFFARGPGIKPGSLINDIILNIDLAPTFLDVAGLEIPPRMDGVSFQELLRKGKDDERRIKRRDTFLITAPGSRETNSGPAKGSPNKSPVPEERFDTLEHEFTRIIGKNRQNRSHEQSLVREKTIGRGEECSRAKMICVRVDKYSWQMPPFWNAEPFCSCINADNNIYSCLRTVNETDNFLYCRFDGDVKTFFDMKIDPFQLSNRFEGLTASVKSYLRDRLERLERCRGSEDCTL